VAALQLVKRLPVTSITLLVPDLLDNLNHEALTPLAAASLSLLEGAALAVHTQQLFEVAVGPLPDRPLKLLMGSASFAVYHWQECLFELLSKVAQAAPLSLLEHSAHLELVCSYSDLPPIEALLEVYRRAVSSVSIADLMPFLGDADCRRRLAALRALDYRLEIPADLEPTLETMRQPGYGDAPQSSVSDYGYPRSGGPERELVNHLIGRIHEPGSEAFQKLAHSTMVGKKRERDDGPS
jgi:hypothetical protein